MDHTRTPPTGPPGSPQLALRPRAGGTVALELSGDWRAKAGLPTMEAISQTLAVVPKPAALSFETGQLQAWDSGLVAFVMRCAELCEKSGVAYQPEGLPAGVRKLIGLATAVPDKKDARRATGRPPWLQRVGENCLASFGAARDFVTFVGEAMLALRQLFRGRARYRWSDTFLIMQEAGAEALGIVSLINFLVGMIISFVGAVQLSRFGASIYVADLVGIATVRELAAIMTGIIMCGRTGASFAAQLGTMKVTEEIDAFRTFGIPPIEFLVLPRMIALFLMMPLLCVYANLMGILGGFCVAILMLDLSVLEYWNETVASISLTNFALGISKGAVFGVLVALTGCLRGMQCGNNAAAVGQATTSAVVLGITAIIVADAVFAVLCNVLGI